MKFKSFWLLLFLTFCTEATIAQTQSVMDSLQKELAQGLAPKEKIKVLNLLAAEYKHEDSAKTAFYVEQVIELSNQEKYPEGKADAYYSIAWSTLDSEDYDKALELFQSSLQVAIDAEYLKGEGNAYNGIGHIYGLAEDYDRSLWHYQKGLEIMEEIGEDDRAAAFLFNMGIVYKDKGDSENAIDCYEKAMKLYGKLGDIASVGDCYSDLGDIYYYEGNNPKALEKFFKGLEVREALEDTFGVANLCNNIGIIYDELDDPEKALEYYERVLVLMEALEEREVEAMMLHNIGIMYRNKEVWGEAVDYLKRSLDIYTDLGIESEIATCYASIGGAYVKLYRYAAANEYLQKSIKLATAVGNTEAVAAGKGHLGEMYFYQGKYEQAITLLKESLSAFKIEGRPEEVVQNSGILYQAYAKAGKKAEAFDMLLFHKQVSDSSQNDEVTKRVAQLGFQRKQDIKDKEEEIKRAKEEAEQLKILQKQKYLTYIFVGGFILLGIIATVIFRSYREKNKANALLSSQNEEIRQQAEEIQTQRDNLADLNDNIEKEKEEVVLAYRNIQLLSKIGRDITSHISLERIIDTVYAEINQLMPADGFGIGIYNKKENRIDFPSSIEKGQKQEFYYDELGDNDTLSDYCFNNEEAVFIQDYQMEINNYLSTTHNDPKVGSSPGSVIYLPLKTTDRMVGNIHVYSFKTHAYTGNHLSVFRNLAVYTAIALDNASLYNRTESLLLNILPEETAYELKEKGYASTKKYEHVSVLFTDFKGFTTIAEKMDAEEVVANLNYCFTHFDRIIKKHKIEKIKTIGDAYMCAGGIPVADEDNPHRVVQAALEIRDFMLTWKAEKESKNEQAWEVRIGIHTGPLVAGVVGEDKFAYDIWGDTVNLAARMESSGEPGKVNVSESTYSFVKEDFDCEYRGEVQAKNKGKVAMYFVS